MAAIDWIRSKATVRPSMADVLEYNGRKYRSEWRFFNGRLPYRMRKELSAAAWRKGEFEMETFRNVCTPSGHQTGEVEYAFVTYTAI